MSRTNLMYGAAFVGLLGLIAGAVVTVSRSTPDDTSLSTVLGASNAPQMVRLYPGDKDPATGAYKNPHDRALDDANNGVATSRSLKNKDGSTEEITLKADGEHFASRQTFYPQAAEEDPRRPHISQLYAADVDFVLEEDVTRPDGTTDTHTHATPDGAKLVTGYGADGNVVISEMVMNPRRYSYTSPVLGREEHWLDDENHTLVYQNLLNPPEPNVLTDNNPPNTPNTNSKQRLIFLMKTPSYDSVSGTTITAWNDDGSVRLEAKGDYHTNTAKYFRLDGTVDYVLKLSYGMTIIDYYDRTGTKVVLSQWWWPKEKEENGVKKRYYELYSVTEMDENGEKKRDFNLSDGKISFLEVYNTVVDGVHYGEVDYIFDSRTRTVSNIRYWVGKADHPYEREDVHTPEDKIVAPAVPADELVLRVNPDQDDLPVPPPQRGPYG